MNEFENFVVSICGDDRALCEAVISGYRVIGGEVLAEGIWDTVRNNAGKLAAAGALAVGLGTADAAPSHYGNVGKDPAKFQMAKSHKQNLPQQNYKVKKNKGN